MKRAHLALALVLVSCTPAETAADVKFVTDALACIAKNAVPDADPRAVAITCAVQSVPDDIAVIQAVIDAKTNVAAKRAECITVRIVDAGTPLDGSGK